MHPELILSVKITFLVDIKIVKGALYTIFKQYETKEAEILTIFKCRINNATTKEKINNKRYN